MKNRRAQYKDVTVVVDAAHAAKLSSEVVTLDPLVCIKDQNDKLDRF